MNIEIRHRITGAVIRVVDANDLRGANLRDADLHGADLSYADLRGANLSYADLRGANLHGADLSHANLHAADLHGAGLSYADLRGADLRGADLHAADLHAADLHGAGLSYADVHAAGLSYADVHAADLRYANLRGADLRYANLRDANLSYADLRDAKGITAPVVPNLDDAILAALESGGTLNMDSWHMCDTTHCRAGWAVYLAGTAGRALEDRIGPSAAGALIYHASTGRVPDFSVSNEEALADIRACAANAGGKKP